MTDQTSTDVKFEPKYAGFWRRVGAAIIDWLLLAGFGFVIATILGVDLTKQHSAQFETIVNLIGLIEYWLYFAILECSKLQASVGKRFLRLRVTDLSGERISFGKATGRHFGKIVSFVILLIGFLMVGWTEKKQGLHDKMAGTLVIVH